MGYKYLNLDFLRSQIPDMPEEIKGLLQLSIENINEIVGEVKSSLENRDWEALKFSTHQLKTNFKILGMENLADEIQTIEHDAKMRENLDSLFERTNHVLMHWNGAAAEIEQELSK